MDKKNKLEQLHKKMIEEIQDYAIVLLDIDGTILTWNKGVERIKGYTAEEIIGQNFSIFLYATGSAGTTTSKIIRSRDKRRKSQAYWPPGSQRRYTFLGKHPDHRAS